MVRRPLRLLDGFTRCCRASAQKGRTAAYEALIDTLICERVTNQPEGIGNPQSIRWGSDHEDEARDAYEDATGELVDLVGFIPHPTIEFFGASPDSLVGEDGLLEIKCPYSTNVHL